MAESRSFADTCIVSCGMLRPEVEHLVEEGFLDPYRLLYTAPGLHALPDKLEEQLSGRIRRARELCSSRGIIVIYGRKCYVNPEEPYKSVDSIISSQGEGIVRVQGEYGYDMLAGPEERSELSEGEPDKVLWFGAGWLEHWKTVYQRYLGWDKADANANFPGYYRKIIVLDGIGISNRYINEHPEEILEIFDWTGLEVEFREITLDRFKGLLLDALGRAVEGR